MELLVRRQEPYKEGTELCVAWFLYVKICMCTRGMHAISQTLSGAAQSASLWGREWSCAKL